MVTRHEGALTSFGLHKGSGLAVLCEAMSAVLTGGRRADEEQSGGVLNAMLAIIIDTKHLAGLGDLQAGFAAVAHLMGWTATRAPGCSAMRRRMPSTAASS